MKKMKRYRYKKLQSRRGGKTGKKRLICFLLSLCLAMELPLFQVLAFGAEISLNGTEKETPDHPGDVLYDSLEPFEELELTAEEIAEAESENPSPGMRKKPSARAVDEWEKYGSDYYYARLTSEERAFWDLLDGQCADFLVGTSDASCHVNPETKNTTYRLAMLNYRTGLGSGMALDYDRATKVYQMFRYSRPQYYFLTNSTFRDKVKKEDGTVDKSLDKGNFQLGVFPAFAKGTDRMEANARIGQRIEEMLARISKETNPLMKEKTAHDLICESVSYDMYYNTMAKNEYNQTIYSVLCDERKTTVCAGYSQTMMLLMNASGIECAMSISSTHAWNMVNLDVGSGQGLCWYYTDLTWDDQPDGWIYNYFNRSRDAIHKIDTESHREEPSWVPYLPDMAKDACVTEPPKVQLQNGLITMSSPSYGIYYTLNSGQDRLAYTSPIPAKEGMRIEADSDWNGYFQDKRFSTSVCRINFVLEGNAYGTSPLVLEGQRIGEPAVTPPAGYTFSGWHTNPECTNPYSFSGYIRSSMTLYGRYQKIVEPEKPEPEKIFHVLFDSCGGTSLAAQSIKEGGQVQNKTPKRKGYSFVGWYTSKDYSSPYDFSAGVTRDMVLFAKWKANTYKVTYRANGGYIGKKTVTSQKKTVTYDRKYGSLPKAKRKGYVFLGWYTKKSGGSRIDSSQTVKITGPMTCYARWSKVKPAKASLSSVKSREPGKVTVKIKKKDGASGYEIRYSLKSSMSSSKKVKASGTEKTISGLKKGKKYYVQVRMYQKESVSGKNSYGAWSGKRTVTVKKK